MSSLCQIRHADHTRCVALVFQSRSIICGRQTHRCCRDIFHCPSACHSAVHLPLRQKLRAIELHFQSANEKPSRLLVSSMMPAGPDVDYRHLKSSRPASQLNYGRAVLLTIIKSHRSPAADACAFSASAATRRCHQKRPRKLRHTIPSRRATARLPPRTPAAIRSTIGGREATSCRVSCDVQTVKLCDLLRRHGSRVSCLVRYRQIHRAHGMVLTYDCHAASRCDIPSWRLPVQLLQHTAVAPRRRGSGQCLQSLGAGAPCDRWQRTHLSLVCVLSAAVVGAAPDQACGAQTLKSTTM